MISNVGGRYRSSRNNEEYLTLFKRELSSLPPHELEIALKIFEDLQMQAPSPLYNAASDEMYLTSPVSMEQFLSDEYFLGNIGRSLFPEIKKSLIEMFEGQYSLSIVGGSLGAGKTSTGVIGIIRMIYEVSCLRDVQTSYGIASSDSIIFPCVAATEFVAETQILDKIRAYLNESPYFTKEYKPVSDTIGRGVEFPNRVIIPPGASTQNGILGGNAFGCFIDEANFFKGRQQDGNVQKKIIRAIYEGIKRRMESRFMSRGKLPGLMIIASSKQTENSFTEEVIRESVDDPTVYVRESAVYEVVPSERYCGDKFRVAVGNETRISKILVDGEPDPDGMLVIEVPIEHRKAFEDDIDAAIRDVAGRSTVAITPFITRREKIYECIDKTRSHPFSFEIWDQSFPGKIKWADIAKIRADGAWEPRLNPSAPRHIHLDLSATQDRTGICVSHIAGYKTVQRVGADREEQAPIISVDFMLGIQAPAGGEIVYSEIRRLIYEFSTHGFFIKKVSADQFQSRMLLQMLMGQGYQTEVVSVEPSGGPYELLKQAIYENRMSYYNYGPVIKELTKIQKNWKNGKIDHLQGETKDISDALAACVATLTKSSYSVIDVPIATDKADVLLNDDAWVLDDRDQIPITDGNSGDNTPEWRKNAQQQQDGSSDWKNNFQMPFLTG